MFNLVLRLQKLSNYLIYFTIILFFILGTIASLPSTQKNELVQNGFLYSPFILFLLIPIVLFQVFLLKRLNLLRSQAIYIMIAVAIVLCGFAPVYGVHTLFYGCAGWLAVSVVMGWQIKDMVKFFATQTRNQQNKSSFELEKVK